MISNVGGWVALRRHIIWVVFVLACSPVLHAERMGSIELTPCHLPTHSREVLCGSHTVFEDRVSGEGREIEIQFAVIPAVGEEPELDPVVVFAGGPGQAAMELAPFAAVVFSEVIETRHVVLIDQRGMGSSAPLTCDLPEDEVHLAVVEQRLRTREVLEECLAELDADVTLYTQELANQDIHEILGVLGFEQANLYGASWGTRSALLYAHQFPEGVRSLVLDGALPLVNTAPLYAAADADRALRALFSDCQAAPGCVDSYPDLEGLFFQALEVLGDDEKLIEVEDPTTGKPERVMMSRDIFGGILRGILYIPDLSRVVPLIIQQASTGEYEALLGVAGFLASATGDAMTLGASLTIFCSEELARMEPEALVSVSGSPGSEAAASLVGASFLLDLQSSCSVWPRAPLPELYRQDVRSEAPALVLSGDIDPITPPRWGQAMSEILPNSLHLVAPNTGHNVSPVGCAPELIAQFVQQGTLDGIDGSCLDEIQRPSFFVDSYGPRVSQ